MNGRRFMRLAMRSANQVAISVLATLAASAIYAGLRHPAGEAAAPPAFTSGGKLAARIDHAALPPSAAPAPVLPILTLANWSVPAAVPVDPDWVAPQAPVAAARPQRPGPRRTPAVVAAAPLAAVPLPLTPPVAHVADTSLDVAAPPAIVVADRGDHFWAAAASVFSTAASAMGSATMATTAVVSSATSTAGTAVRHVVVAGGSLVAHVIP